MPNKIINNKNSEWFKEWFNSPFYHILYKHRDDSEAKAFIDNLIENLTINYNDKILDLACGRGRHSVYLNNRGFNVTGADYSSENIKYAKQFENDSLHFVEHDMRCNIQTQFSVILNLFTSFGYFESTEEDYNVLNACYNCLKSNGVFILDFHNTNNIIQHLVETEVKIIDEHKFYITRSFENGFIYKNIEVKTNNKSEKYNEKVKALTYSDFIKLINQTPFTLEKVFGNYQLESYNESNSDRMIFVLRKN